MFWNFGVYFHMNNLIIYYAITIDLVHFISQTWFLAIYIYLIKFECFCFKTILDHPAIENIPRQFVNESDTVMITRNIDSNPLSNVLWYAKEVLLDTQTYVTKATYSKEKASCTDTQNFTIVARNGIGNETTATVELIVNCK